MTAAQGREPLPGLPTIDARIRVLDVGAACTAESPVYVRLLEAGLAELHAVEGDARLHDGIRAAYGKHLTLHDAYLADGGEHSLHVAPPASGMTSLLAPDAGAHAFFNGFAPLLDKYTTETVRTKRLDDLRGVPPIDFLKMDIQGAELTVLRHGVEKLAGCVAMQLEVSFVALYKDQPTYGEVDSWLRGQGFVPHAFVAVKRWSIAPTLRNRRIDVPFNQLLEADAVYVRDPLRSGECSTEQLKKLALIAHYCYGSIDLCVHLVRELAARGAVPKGSAQRYVGSLAAPG